MTKLQRAEEAFRKDLKDVESTLDPTLREYKVKALDMTIARYEKYHQRAISAGFIVKTTPSSASSTSTSTSAVGNLGKGSHQDDPRPLDSSEINWKLLPKWDVSWKKERDLEAFLKNMSNFRTIVTRKGNRPFAEGACQCWLNTFRHLGGSVAELTSQMEEAQDWDEMQTWFKDWFTKSDGTVDAVHCCSLVWQKDMPIARFGQIFKSAAVANGFISPIMSTELRR
ncbi:MAG: hypothetical protein J3R72DRAFT_464648 [Linnemannia gamsii]|nr:MAG: hypothetical protein J3R72DRAFT_464648 [Linnemannia gamsii]